MRLEVELNSCVKDYSKLQNEPSVVRAPQCTNVRGGQAVQQSACISSMPHKQLNSAHLISTFLVSNAYLWKRHNTGEDAQRLSLTWFKVKAASEVSNNFLLQSNTLTKEVPQKFLEWWQKTPCETFFFNSSAKVLPSWPLTACWSRKKDFWWKAAMIHFKCSTF